MNRNNTIPTDAQVLKLEVDVIDTLPALQALRQEWDRLYDADPESSVFLSWAWLNEAFRDNPYRWSILVVRQVGQPSGIVAALPLKYRVHWSQSQQEFQSEIEAGGRLLWSEYTGFLCRPQFETLGLEALVTKLSKMPWTKFSLRYVHQMRRAKLFTDLCQKAGFIVKYKHYLINKKQTDNLICPQIDLPESYQAYQANQISANKRQKYRSAKRKHFETGECQITEATDKSFDADVTELLKLWQDKWTPSKGETQARSVARNYYQVLDAARKIGKLYMPVLRQNGKILGALGHVVDEKSGVVHYIIAGRSVTSAAPFIGTALHFHSIEWAIRNEFICYDFCHGNEPFKYDYGAQDSKVAYFEIKRTPCPPNLAFDSINTGEALKRTQRFVIKGKHEDAAIACGQLSKLLS